MYVKSPVLMFIIAVLCCLFTTRVVRTEPQRQHPAMWESQDPELVPTEYKANASRLMWYIFKRKNEGRQLDFQPLSGQELPRSSDDNLDDRPLPRQPPSISSHKPYPRRRKNGEKKKKQKKQKQKQKKKQLHLDKQQSSAINFPPMIEQPFEVKHLPTNQEMLQILKLEHFNTDFMGISKPREALDYPQGKLYIPPPRNRQSSNYSLRRIMRHYSRLPYGQHLKVDMNRRLKRKLRRFLAGYTLCPVWYTWHHMEARFWPRWIKFGRCANLGSSCSLPPGMTCQEGNYQKVGVLRYICPKDWKPEQCGWRRIFIDILKDCKCACGKN